MNDHKFDCELLRPVEYISEPDPRTAFHSKQLVHFHDDVASLNLHNKVPQNISIQFETVKNLYLYGWFIYRFYTVSENLALSCLEFALRSRYRKIIPKKTYFPKQKEPGLPALLRYASDRKDIKNEEFETWRKITFNKARCRYKHNKSQEMHEKGLNKIILNFDDVEIGEEDKDWNYVQVLNEVLPKIRNNHAHGGDELDSFHTPLHTIKIVSEVINQIYSNEP